MKEMNLREFREDGWLFEVNRQFFHPLGLALSVVVQPDGSVELSGIFDNRDDDEGMIMGAEAIAEYRERSRAIIAEQERRKAIRRHRLGFDVEPLDCL